MFSNTYTIIIWYLKEQLYGFLFQLEAQTGHGIKLKIKDKNMIQNGTYWSASAFFFFFLHTCSSLTVYFVKLTRERMQS